LAANTKKLRSLSFRIPSAKEEIPGKTKRRAFQPAFADFLLLDRAALTVTAHALKADGAVNHCKQRIIAADANALTGMDMSAALTNQNITGQDELTIAALDAKTLRLGVTTVLGRTYAFFMCHCLFPP
jgi:hypothetical protein